MQRIYISPQTFTGLNTTIDLPVSVEDFSNIGAISLELYYNKDILQFESLENTQNTIRCDYNEYTPGFIRVSYTGNGQSISDGSIFLLKFKALQASVTSVGFTTQTPGLCEIADAGAEVLPFTFENGQITIED
jgi:hypothetical protein